MAYVILHNNFSNDPILIRLARLFLLSNNLPPFLPELALPPDYQNWALSAYDKFNVATGNQNVQQGEKEEAFRLSDVAMKTLGDYYAILKDVLLARYSPSELPVCYGMKGVAPESKQGVFDASQKLIYGHNERVAVGDPLVLPDVMINKLIGFRDNADASWDGAYAEAGDVETATEEMRALYNADTQMLRIIYNWICAMWRRDDPRLIEIGFVPRSYEGQGGGGAVPDAPAQFKIKWRDPELEFTWHPSEGATSYQLAFSADNGATWEELYSGDELEFAYEPPAGKRFYRVRARNADGYGEWSIELEYEVGGEGVGRNDWPDEPQNLGAEVITMPSLFMKVYYLIPTGSDSVSIYRAVVLAGSPAPTSRPAVVYVEEVVEEQYADTDIEAGNDYYYWVCGVKDGIEGDFAGPAMASV